MKKGLFVALSIVALVSCKKELVPQESTISYTEKSPNLNLQNPNNEISSKNTVVQQKTNPPHGQPGHICGNQGQQNTQPQVSPGATQQYTINQPTTTKTVTQTPAKVAKGMNPAHGQPGHRCDIAVGAPLNSKPNTTTATTIPTSTTVQNNSTPALLTPTNNTTSTTPVKVEPGMNPPHGQEGHVCGIPVGSPLNQEKETEEKKDESPK